MEKTPKLIIGIVIATLAVLGFASYGYLQSREYLRGPVIAVEEPKNGALSTTSLITVRGNARNISFLTLNGRQIFTDEQGRFREALLLQNGYNIMTIEAKDRFGHIKTKRLELVYKPLQNQNGNSKMENETTTAPQF
ncbi:MAG TPA: hypothetical protein VJJ55_00630 [Candidatus Paceibacterota bacterium]